MNVLGDRVTILEASLVESTKSSQLDIDLTFKVIYVPSLVYTLFGNICTPIFIKPPECSISMTIAYVTLDPSPVTNIEAGTGTLSIAGSTSPNIEILQDHTNKKSKLGLELFF